MLIITGNPVRIQLTFITYPVRFKIAREKNQIALQTLDLVVSFLPAKLIERIIGLHCSPRIRKVLSCIHPAVIGIDPPLL